MRQREAEGMTGFVMRNLNNWEIGEYEKLLSTLFIMTLDRSHDNPMWCLTTNGPFCSNLDISIHPSMKTMELGFRSDKFGRLKFCIMYLFLCRRLAMSVF